MTNTFIPESFTPPEILKADDFTIRKLLAKDVYLDYMAVMSSIDIIDKTRGGTWPTPDLSFDDDFIDLAWHQREFEHGSSFAYTVVNHEETECLGCLYLYPAGFRKEAQPGADVDVSFWVTQKPTTEVCILSFMTDCANGLKKSGHLKCQSGAM